MVEIKKITKDRITEIASTKGFNSIVMTKDYYVTAILYLLKDLKGLYFEGGTALQKIFLDYARLSEDVDYTVTKDLDKIKKQVTDKLMSSGLFEKATEDKDVEGYTRIVLHYKNLENQQDTVFIDLNRRAKLLEKPEKQEIIHFYTEEIPRFSVNTLAKKELFAEKLSAAINRNKPRDHFDIYMITKKGYKIDQPLARKKCEQSGTEYDIVRMFKRANKLHKRWDEDILPLLAEDVSFKEVMTTLAKHFKLQEHR